MKKNLLLLLCLLLALALAGCQERPIEHLPDSEIMESDWADATPTEPMNTPHGEAGQINGSAPHWLA